MIGMSRAHAGFRQGVAAGFRERQALSAGTRAHARAERLGHGRLTAGCLWHTSENLSRPAVRSRGFPSSRNSALVLQNPTGWCFSTVARFCSRTNRRTGFWNRGRRSHRRQPTELPAELRNRRAGHHRARPFGAGGLPPETVQWDGNPPHPERAMTRDLRRVKHLELERRGRLIVAWPLKASWSWDGLVKFHNPMVRRDGLFRKELQEIPARTLIHPGHRAYRVFRGVDGESRVPRDLHHAHRRQRRNALGRGQSASNGRTGPRRSVSSPTSATGFRRSRIGCSWPPRSNRPWKRSS